MYFCQVTGKLSEQGEKLNKIVVATRAVQYKNWDSESEEYWFSHGVEVAREINACEEGLRVWAGMTPEAQTALVKGL